MNHYSTLIASYSAPTSRVPGTANHRLVEVNPTLAMRRVCSSPQLASNELRADPTRSRPFLQLATGELLEATARSRPFLQLASSELLEAPTRLRPFLWFASSGPLEASTRTRPFLQLTSSELLEAPTAHIPRASRSFGAITPLSASSPFPDT